MILPFVTYRPVARIDDGPRDVRWNAAVLHTCVCGVSDLYDYWSHGAPPGVGSHFYVARDGKAFQYLDTRRMTGHAYGANPWTVGIETQDDGNPANPWTVPQLEAIVAILRALQVPPVMLSETPSNGVGYHEQYPSWNRSGHLCPGKVREAQIPTILNELATTPGGDGVSVKDLQDYFGIGAPGASSVMDFLAGQTIRRADLPRPMNVLEARGWDHEDDLIALRTALAPKKP